MQHKHGQYSLYCRVQRLHAARVPPKKVPTIQIFVVTEKYRVVLLVYNFHFGFFSAKCCALHGIECSSNPGLPCLCNSGVTRMQPVYGESKGGA